jgi:hypothetical protein
VDINRRQRCAQLSSGDEAPPPAGGGQCDNTTQQKIISSPARGVDLLEAGQARVGLERRSKLFNPCNTDRVVAEAALT